MAILTKKFSEFLDAGNLANDDITVGLGSGTNAQYNNPWTFLPPGTTGERPTPSSSVNFRLRYNTTSNQYEYYDSNLLSWIQLATSSTPSFTWVVVDSTSSVTMAPNHGYIISYTLSYVDLLLPPASTISQQIGIIGVGGSMGWRVTQGAGQYVYNSIVATTPGVTGSMTSASPNDSASLICIGDNLGWATFGAPQSTGLIMV